MRALAIITLALATLFVRPSAALEVVDLRADYRLRFDPNTSRPPAPRINRVLSATIVGRRGPWRQVCVGGPRRTCRLDETRWIFEKGIVPRVTEPADAQDSVAQCIGGECARKSKKGVAQAAEPITKLLDQNPTGYQLPASFPASCAAFISPTGWGEWGRHMHNAIQKVRPTCLDGGNTFKSMCPNYAALPQKKKKAFLALTFAAMGAAESTCGLRLRAQGVNGIADGMFQMEKSQWHRRRRSVRWCRSDREFDTQRADFQSECTISIIQDTVCKSRKRIDYPDGYWAELRGNGAITNMIRSTARQWKLCH